MATFVQTTDEMDETKCKRLSGEAKDETTLRTFLGEDFKGVQNKCVQ